MATVTQAASFTPVSPPRLVSRMADRLPALCGLDPLCQWSNCRCQSVIFPPGPVVAWNSKALEFVSALEYVLTPSEKEKLVTLGKIFALTKLGANGDAVVNCPLIFWPIT